MKQIPLGEYLKLEGMSSSVDNANDNVPGWSNEAYECLIDFLKYIGKKEFMAEDVRQFAVDNGLPEPPSLRAWGAIMVRARKNKLITFVEWSPVSNSRAHCTPASIWRAL